jgi:radical SAM superfamily enzyme YgiQ (UPF0313 family)
LVYPAFQSANFNNEQNYRLCYAQRVKILLVGINAKYSHTNLAIRLMHIFAQTYSPAVLSGDVTVLTGEWNINLSHGAVLRGIVNEKPEMILFSTYIWNRTYIFNIAADVRRLFPETIIGFGGPEVSWSVEETFSLCPAVDIILSGEGEEILCDLIQCFSGKPGDDQLELFSSIPGVSIRERQNKAIRIGKNRSLIEDLGIIPFPYATERLDFNPNKIVYYESSRGCPFSCAYCLSSIDKTVRYYPLDRVLRDIGFFIDGGYPLVKFVDRTFNLDPDRYLTIWKYIRDRNEGRTLFHFEIAAEYLTDEAFALLETMPEGAIQFEIGIQSINPETLKIVGRPAHPDKLAEKIRRIPRTIHTHVDLIAGLPAENLESFGRSFDYAYGLDAGMLQLGFLKILSGSPMEGLARSETGFIWSSIPPYEVLSNPVLPYDGLLVLKDVEQLVDTWHNTYLMKKTLNYLAQSRPGRTAFSLFIELGAFVRTYYPDGDLYLPRKSADSFSCMAAFIAGREGDSLSTGKAAMEYLRYDFLSQGKPGSFPNWYERRYSKEAHDRALEENGLIDDGTASGNGTSRRIVYSRTEYDTFNFGDVRKNVPILFIYGENSTTGQRARCVTIGEGKLR